MMNHPAVFIHIARCTDKMAEILVLGDVHAQPKDIQIQLDNALSMGFVPTCIIQLGDIGVWEEVIRKFPRLKIPLYYVLGNHEMLGAEFVAEERLPPAYHFITPNTPVVIEGLKTIGVSRSKYIDNYNTPPGTTITEDDIEKALLQKDIDMIITHDCPWKIGVKSNFFTPQYQDVGSEQLSRLYALKPKIWLFGHHHLNFSSMTNKCLMIGQTVSADGFGILDTEHLSYRFITWLVEEKKELKTK
jgi:Icc-related predicted phosphoesterase